MKSELQFVGKNEYDGEINSIYKYKNLGVVVSNTRFCYEANAPVGSDETDLHISFSLRSGTSMRQSDVEYCLRHFGMDLDKHFYTFEEMSSGKYGDKMMIRHYEQVQTKR